MRPPHSSEARGSIQWERRDQSGVTWNVGMAYFCTKKWMPMPAIGTSSHKASTSPRVACEMQTVTRSKVRKSGQQLFRMGVN